MGGARAGLCALVLLAACPLYYGHMFMNAKDAPFATAMVVLLLGVVRAFDAYPNPSRRTMVLVGVASAQPSARASLAVVAAALSRRQSIADRRRGSLHARPSPLLPRDSAVSSGYCCRRCRSPI
ncbi:MAG: hypothetical protein WDN48_04855 [Pseudolabrys sp.]